MRLTALLQAAGIHACPATDPDIRGVAEDSRDVGPGWLFVALEGAREDGHRHVPGALDACAAAIVSSRPAPAGFAGIWIQTPNARRSLGDLAHAFLGHPSRGMTVIGVTGTNGKTTTAWLIEAMFRAAGRRTGLLGTLGHRVCNEWLPAPTTTASATRNAALFARMREAGVSAAAMEVSSHAVVQHRIGGIRFRAGVFTNLTQDHLDYHDTMEEYVRAKWRFFEEHVLPQADACAVFNGDDPTGRDFAARYGGRRLVFGRAPDADVRLESATADASGLSLRVNAMGTALELRCGLIGGFNIENTLAATAGALAAGLDMEAIVEGVAAARPVPGRFERIDEGQPFVVAVDYAHTPDALERVMENARSMTQGRLMVVFGCGGDRDKTKRPKMGHAVGRAADHAILTNDNPRTEAPEDIARMAEEGLRQAGMAPGRYEVLLDRRAAIEAAVGLAREGDFVLIAGKGHEDYQEIGRERIHFDDREVARAALGALKARA